MAQTKTMMIQRKTAADKRGRGTVPCPSGYGTKSIKKAASKYGEDNVSFSVEDGIFTLSIKLKYA